MIRVIPTYGIMAEFSQPDALIAAANAAREAGFKRMDAYTPFPIHGLHEALGFHKTRLPLIVLIAGTCGCLGGFFMQYFAAAVHYPLNIGGRPLNSWPAWIIITFEVTILVSGITTVLGMLALNGLPRPYHPVFNASNFELASRTHFFLCIEAADPKFDKLETRRFLESLGANSVVEVPMYPHLERPE